MDANAINWIRLTQQIERDARMDRLNDEWDRATPTGTGSHRKIRSEFAENSATKRSRADGS